MFAMPLLLLSFLLALGLLSLTTDDLWVAAEQEGTTTHTIKPCCFPVAFQATVADMNSASAGKVRLFEVYRDWDKRVQVQRVMEFAPPGQVTPTVTIILDFKKSVQYVLTSSGDCSSNHLNYAMLEPCMPENATYLGETYLGYGVDKTHFRTWSFRREDQGRNISMTVAATVHDCVPVMETITGTLGGARADSLVTFTTFNQLQDPSVFDVPPNCASVH